MNFYWSGRQESNLRPHGPKPRVLPTAPHPDVYKRAVLTLHQYLLERRKESFVSLGTKPQRAYV